MTSKISQRRRELDARRGKSRVRLGPCIESWGQLKEELGFSLHSELARHLLDRYNSKICIKCSDKEKADAQRNLLTTTESLQELILLVHNHGQICHLPPVLQSKTVTKQQEQDESAHETRRKVVQFESKDFCYLSDMGLKYTCDGGHHFLWFPTEREKSADGTSGDVTPSFPKRRRQGREQLVEPFTLRQQLNKVTRSGPQHGESDIVLKEISGSENSGGDKNAVTEREQDAVQKGGNDEMEVFQLPEHNDEVAVLNLTKRGTQRRVDAGEKQNITRKDGTLKNNSPQSLKDDTSQISGSKKRKTTQKVILPCEFKGCDKIFSSRQYLNHHIKYQHLQQKTFTCSHHTCNKSFNFKKHLKEHEKLHSNHRDFLCEFCARAFRTSSNLIIHRRIHTREKPLQCEVCGFTCRQKASLNWHMRKHNAESTYQFPCEICGRRFEKRDNVTAHRSKSHPDQSIPAPETCFPVTSVSDPLPKHHGNTEPLLP